MIVNILRDGINEPIFEGGVLELDIPIDFNEKSLHTSFGISVELPNDYKIMMTFNNRVLIFGSNEEIIVPTLMLYNNKSYSAVIIRTLDCKPLIRRK